MGQVVKVVHSQLFGVFGWPRTHVQLVKLDKMDTSKENSLPEFLDLGHFLGLHHFSGKQTVPTFFFKKKSFFKPIRLTRQETCAEPPKASSRRTPGSGRFLFLFFVFCWALPSHKFGIPSVLGVDSPLFSTMFLFENRQFPLDV